MRRERLYALSDGTTKTTIASTARRTKARCFAMLAGVTVLPLASEEHDASSCYLALVKAVHPRQKGGDAQRLFKRVRPGGLVKRIFEIPLQLLGDRPFRRDVPSL